MKAGQYIIYRNGERYELGKIKRVTEDGAFVYYSEGDTAAKTPFECMHPLTNEYVIKDTSLGGEQLTIQPEIIRCKDCKWWDRYNDNNGYCMAAKSCTYTSHWDIQIRRTYDGDFYCAHAEPKEEYEEDEDE